MFPLLALIIPIHLLRSQNRVSVHGKTLPESAFCWTYGRPTKNKRVVTSTRTRYKLLRKRGYKFEKTYAKEQADQLQMELVDMSKFRHKNKGYYWILTAVETLSRYAFAILVYHKNTENRTKAVEDLLEQFKTRFGKYPNHSIENEQ